MKQSNEKITQRVTADLCNPPADYRSLQSSCNTCRIPESDIPEYEQLNLNSMAVLVGLLSALIDTVVHCIIFVLHCT